MAGIQRNNRKVHLISLGCARNRVDSEVMLGVLLNDGWKVVESPEEADAVIINTCAFIGPAKEESIDHILGVAALKEERPGMKIAVAGCLPQRYKAELAKEMPEVDVFVGTDEFPRMAEFLRDADGGTRLHVARTKYIYTAAMPRVNTLSAFSAYVKVAEGCQHRCSFCVIPKIRGPLRSRPIENVVEEARGLAAGGVSEFNLIAQDLAAYGRDLRDGTDLLGLLKALVKIKALKWVRLLYMYPENISDEFLKLMAGEEKIVPYLDIPVQHASDKILKAMARNITASGLRDILGKTRDRVPGIALRTSVMTGFPGETEADFEELRTFVKEQKFDHLGCFTYSREEDTVAAELPNQVPEALKKQRAAKIMRSQKAISAKIQAGKVGRTFDVLVEGRHEETDLLWKGRLATQAPEVDGHVIINAGEVKAGQIVPVRVTESHDYDLVGELASAE